MNRKQKIRWVGGFILSCAGCLMGDYAQEPIEASISKTSHIGTFNGSTTFVTSSENGIQPEFFVEVLDADGELKQYQSKDNILTVPNTEEGAYVTQAKFFGKTKYVKKETGEILESFEERENLRLESVKNPILKTIGKNLFNPDEYKKGFKDKVIVHEDGSIESVGDIKGGNHNLGFLTPMDVALKPNTQYTLCLFNLPTSKQVIRIEGCLSTKKAELLIPNLGIGEVAYKVFTTNSENYKDGVSFKIMTDTVTKENAHYQVMLIEGSEKVTTFEPYQENILQSDDEIVLREVGGVSDTFDLVTGGLVQRIGEIVLDGSESYNQPFGGVYEYVANDDLTNRLMSVPSTSVGNYNNSDFNGYYYPIGTKQLRFIQHDCSTVVDFKEYLANNQRYIQYELPTLTKKTLRISSDCIFHFVYRSKVKVEGSIVPLITSITVPTDELSFVLDPNQEARQQFISPEFEVTNESNAPLTLTLKNFEQITDVFNDVLPETHEPWEGLSEEQSKDIALGLIAQSSDDWLNRIEKTHYVSETTNKLLGTIKPKGTVGFNFIAHHGQAFSEVLNPSYRLTFVFDLLN